MSVVKIAAIPMATNMKTSNPNNMAALSESLESVKKLNKYPEKIKSPAPIILTSFIIVFYIST